MSEKTENKAELGGRRKRISQILPQFREQIPSLFDRGMPAERIAEQFSIPKMEILEEILRNTREGRGKPPQSDRPYGGFRLVGGRRSAA